MRPSAFYLPEIASWLQEAGVGVAQHNFCADGPPRYFKPQWGGRVPPGSTRTFGRLPLHEKHEELVGGARTRLAAAYPPRLCTAVAKLVLDSWEDTLVHEWKVGQAQRFADLL